MSNRSLIIIKLTLVLGTLTAGCAAGASEPDPQPALEGEGEAAQTAQTPEAPSSAGETKLHLNEKITCVYIPGNGCCGPVGQPCTWDKPRM